jgi:hypothetical protein
MPFGSRVARAQLLLAMSLLAVACSHGSLISQSDAEARIDSDAALNTSRATYHLSHVRLTLEKVVALPDGMLGLRFSYGGDSSDCCRIFPFAALPGSQDDPAAGSTDVVIPRPEAGANGVIPMHLWIRATDEKPSFQVDLASLGVPKS